MRGCHSPLEKKLQSPRKRVQITVSLSDVLILMYRKSERLRIPPILDMGQRQMLL